MLLSLNTLNFSMQAEESIYIKKYIWPQKHQQSNIWNHQKTMLLLLQKTLAKVGPFLESNYEYKYI